MFNCDTLVSELNKYRYKIEMHCHSNPASPCGDYSPEEVVRIYSELGYDGIVLTNHIKTALKAEGECDRDYVQRYIEDYHKACEAAEKTDLRVIYGMEIRFPGDSNDYLVYGVDEGQTEELFSYLSGDLSSMRRDYKNDGILLIQAHPCRSGCTAAEPSLLDGVEVINLHPYHNSAMAFAARFYQDVGGVVTSGSDFHHPDTAGLGGIYTKKLPRDTHELAQILRAGDYLLDFGGFPMIPWLMKQ